MVEDTGFDKFIQDLFYGLTQKKRGVWTEGDRLQHLVLVFTKNGLPRDAKYFENKFHEWEKENRG
jgi:hypothetical protein